MKYKYKIGNLVYFDRDWTDVGFIQSLEHLDEKDAGGNQYCIYWFNSENYSIICEEDLNGVE